MNELIRVAQIPIIEDRLHEVKARVDKRVADAMALVCTEETVQAVKTTRTELNKEFGELEDLRKAVKAAVLDPYNRFEAVYRECVHIQYAKHLTYLKVGDGAEGYINDNLVALTLGNNTLLRTLDARNCTRLTQQLDASGCTNIEEVLLDGTAVVGITLPRGGILKKLHLPATVTDLTIINQPKLTEFVMPSYANITTLWLENVSEAVPMNDILAAIPANSRVRLIGIDQTVENAADIVTFYAYLDTMRGLDEQGNNTDTAQVSGTIHIDSLTGAELAAIQGRYPSIVVDYKHLTSHLYFYDDTGTTLLYTAAVNGGEDAVYGGTTPTKASDAQYTYAFAGWSRTPGGSADPTALKNITADRSVYAVYNKTLRTYTVKWYSGSTLLETDSNVPYGTVPTYNGSEPAYTGDGDPTEYQFTGWSPAVGAITGDTTYTAVFKYSGYIYTKLIGRSISGEYTSETVETVGPYAFYSCSRLTTVVVPAAMSIGNYAFQGCTGLSTVDFPAVTSINRNAFYLCSNLTTANFPVATSIGQDAFGGCSKLTALVLRSETMATAGSNVLLNTPIASGTGYIYVPRALVDSYKSASVWSTYANQFRAIEDYPEITGGESA